jgi:hypothetical protein
VNESLGIRLMLSLDQLFLSAAALGLTAFLLLYQSAIKDVILGDRRHDSSAANSKPYCASEVCRLSYENKAKWY